MFIILSRRKLFLLKKKLFIVLVVFIICPYFCYLLWGSKLFTYYVPALAGYDYQETVFLWRIMLDTFTFYDFGF